jgi:hypothetical protein
MQNKEFRLHWYVYRLRIESSRLSDLIEIFFALDGGASGLGDQGK